MKKIYLLYCLFALAFVSCQKEELLPVEPQNSFLETVSEKEALDLLNNFSGTKTFSKSLDDSYAEPHWDSISYEELLNTEEKILVIPATIRNNSGYSRILMMKLEEKVEARIMTIYPNETLKNQYFTGNMVLRSLSGEFLIGFRVRNGVLISKLLPAQNKTLNKTADCEEAYSKESNDFCNSELDEVMLDSTTSSPTPYVSISTIYSYESGGTNEPYYYKAYDDGPSGGGADSTTTTTEEDAAAAIEEKIDDSKLEDCLKKILSSLKGHRHGVGNIIVELSENDYSNFNWAVVSGTSTSATATATTSINYNTLTNTATTTFNAQTFSSGTDLSWARTFLHEAVHAYVVSVSNTSSLTLEDRKELLGPNWIIAYINDGHDYIAQTYVTSIADVLQEYGQLKGYTMDRQFYEDLAWGGLQGTNAFNNLSSTAKNRILDLIAIELTGKDRYGNNKTPKGTNAGC